MKIDRDKKKLQKNSQIKGIIKKDKKTKDLVKRIGPGEIALIDHKDIDEVAGYSLVQKKIKGVINLSSSISGKYPNLGPGILVDSGALLIDEANRDLWEKIREGEEVEICRGIIFRGQEKIGSGIVLDAQKIEEKINSTYENLDEELGKFVQNTLQYAQKEKKLITGKIKIPVIDTPVEGRHVLVVVRGQRYKEDLKTITSYIKEVKPVIICVDGGADAIREFGFKPDIIIGDMDSVSDEALQSEAELIVHAYPDGRAPGMERIKGMGLSSKTFSAPGTSEDIAMLLAYEKGADLIVALGTHSNMIDFLEKGRKGMASTFLVRLKVGTRLVDARGVSQLYQGKVNKSLLASLIIAALIPVIALILFSPTIQHVFNLLFLKLRYGLGGG